MDTEQRLSGVLSEFAHTLVTDFPIQAILDHLVVRIVDVLPISAAGVTLIAPGSAPHHVASSDALGLQFEQLQTELDEGPCLAACAAGLAIAVPDLRGDDRFPTFARRALADGLAAVFTFPLRHADARLGALDLYRTTPGALSEDHMTIAQTLADVAAAYLINAQARIELQESSRRAQHRLLHDPLTDLANRTLLLDRLDRVRLHSQRAGRTAAVLYADLDLFKTINDTYGHRVGDELLVAVARRLESVIRPGDTVARFGGDEFVMLCLDLEELSAVDPVAARIEAALAEPFRLSVGDLRVSASIGIAFVGPSGHSAEAVLEEADVAMYQAKRAGGARHNGVDLVAHRVSNHRSSLSRDLQGALARGELCLEYQPIVAVSDGRLSGVEALLRWMHPIHGAVAPSTAVPIAEQYGLIAEIGRWVLERACLDLRQWHRHPRAAEVNVFVNVSAHQLTAGDFAAEALAVLAATGTDPARVTLEITESAFVHDKVRVRTTLDTLEAAGLRLALDDFGTGHASLRDLGEFPVAIVKIDRDFVNDLRRDPASRLIVEAIVGLAHDLELAVIAEGIETAEQYDDAVAVGCDHCQGFFLASPKRAEVVGELFEHASFPWTGRPAATGVRR